jgi:hypothetical protein
MSVMREELRHLADLLPEAGLRPAPGLIRAHAAGDHGPERDLPFSASSEAGPDLAGLAETYLDLPPGIAGAAVAAITRRPGLTGIATPDHRHFTVIKPRHVQAFTLLLGPAHALS